MSSSNFQIEQGGFSYEDWVYVYMGKNKLTEKNLPKEKTPEWKALEVRQKALFERGRSNISTRTSSNWARLS
jgi:hypothetical protein